MPTVEFVMEESPVEEHQSNGTIEVTVREIQISVPTLLVFRSTVAEYVLRSCLCSCVIDKLFAVHSCNVAHDVFRLFGALQLTRNRSDKSSIIVMIASLDETRIVETLRELFLHARVLSRTESPGLARCLGGALPELGHSARFEKVFVRSDWLEW